MTQYPTPLKNDPNTPIVPGQDSLEQSEETMIRCTAGRRCLLLGLCAALLSVADSYYIPGVNPISFDEDQEYVSLSLAGSRLCCAL